MYSLMWLIKQNTPVLLRGSKGSWKLRNDTWLAGNFEKALLSSLIYKLFNVKLEFEKKHVVFHRVPAWDKRVEYAVEVFAEATRLGLVYCGSDNKWHLIPSGALASILVEMKAKFVDIHDKWKRRWLKNKRIELGGPCTEQEYILISTGNYVGIARVLNADKCVIKVKDLAPRCFKPLNKPLLRDLVEFNKAIVEDSASEAKGFIRLVYEKYAAPNKLHVSFSGGADSTATLSLAVEELGAEKVIAVYSDTGLEFPETREYVEKVTSALGVDLVVLKPEVSFLEEIERRGLMSVNNRWCTALMKLRPLRNYYENQGVKLYLDGARDYESTLRAKTPRLAENPTLPGIYRALPIKTWPRILVQLYLYSRDIELNPLYDKGFSRVGCITCPAMQRYELALSYSLHKDVHDEIVNACRLSLNEYMSMKWSGKCIFKTE